MVDDFLNTGSTLDSEWNEAKGYFFRIHLTLLASDQASMNKNYEAQLLALHTLHRELSAQFKKLKEIDEASKADMLFTNAFNVVQMSKRNRVSDLVLLKTLYEYESFLRRIMRERKMDMPRRMDPGTALLQ